MIENIRNKTSSLSIIFVTSVLLIAVAGQNQTLAITLREAWGSIVAQYPYPDYVFKKKRLTQRDIDLVPAVYKRNHKYFLDGPEKWKSALNPYKKHIKKASEIFNVPGEIIAGVILQESAGNPLAQARETSAKGLMQTIDGTFQMAKVELNKMGISINNPFDPRDSILAGSWYLSYCFEQVQQDFPAKRKRSRLKDWTRALEYYYAGPKWGKHPKPILHIYRRGRLVKINKARYSDMVLKYATGLSKSGFLSAKPLKTAQNHQNIYK